MVVYEAASAIVNLPNCTAKELAPAVSGECDAHGSGEGLRAGSGDPCSLPQGMRTLCSFRLVMLPYPLLLYAAAENLWCLGIALLL